MTTTLSSPDFDQDTGRAKKAALKGPVVITDGGKPAHVLLSIADYLRLTGETANIADLMGYPPGVEDAALDIPERRERTRLVDFD